MATAEKYKDLYLLQNLTMHGIYIKVSYTQVGRKVTVFLVSAQHIGAKGLHFLQEIPLLHLNLCRLL